MRKADNLPPSCAVVMKSENLNFLEPCGPVMGLIYLFIFSWNSCAHLCTVFYGCDCWFKYMHLNEGKICFPPNCLLTECTHNMPQVYDFFLHVKCVILCVIPKFYLFLAYTNNCSDDSQQDQAGCNWMLQVK